jgi:hypothetical protein
VSQLESSDAMRYGSSDPSTRPVVVSHTCPSCGGTPPSTRSIYCKPACKQLAYRLRRRTLHSSVDPSILRRELQRRRLLVAHTVYECPRCSDRFLGERRCGDCNVYARSIGLGGSCPDCDTVILLADLLELEGMPSS